MKAIILAALVAASGAQAGVIYTHDSDGETVDLYDDRGACPERTLRVVYTLADRKTQHMGCWGLVGDKVAIRWDDGDRGLMPVQAFRKAVSL
jgi:hypothetical protein